MNQTVAVVVWLFCLELVAWAALPLAANLFERLAGRGAAFARTVGLLVAGYLVWLAASFRLLENTRVTMLLAVLAVAGLSLWVSRRERLLELWRSVRSEVLAVEILFLAAFLGYLAFRAYDPAINHTEQPMDFGFLNAILRSRTFPPRDMWLSGYAISYYYFGYLLMALLTRLSGVPAGVAYNLCLGTVFALTVTGAYGLVRAVVAELLPTERAHRAIGLIGAIFVAVAGNLEGILELLHTNGVGSAAFWRWINIPALTKAPQKPGLVPGTDWWWWRATRLIQDANLQGKMPEVIAEFPAFSFVLGDLHPHVMALPFALLALGLAWQCLRVAPDLKAGGAEGALQRLLPWLPLPPLAPLLPLAIGALGFMNSWDFPTYALVTIAAYAIGRTWAHGRLTRGWLAECGGFACLTLLGGLLLYLPFYIGFRSQAAGFALVDYAKTPWLQYVLVFGPSLSVLVPWLLSLTLAESRQQHFAGTYATVLTVLLVVPLGLLLLGGQGGAPAAALALLSQGPWLALGLGVLVALATALLLRRLGNPARGAASTLALLLTTVGLALTFGTEFVFVRDSFGTRMNTVFKFYYQAWTLLGVSAAIGLAEVLRRYREHRRPRHAVWLGGVALVLLAALYYPLAAATSKAGFFAGQPNLDGTAWLDPASGEGAAIAWLAAHAGDDAIVLEAPGDEYNASHNRVSGWTGIPTVLGWAGHEGQWRGNYDEVMRRRPDIEAIYTSGQTAQITLLLDKYSIDYVYVGPYERDKYGLGPASLRVLDRVLQRVYDRDGVIIYARR